MQRAPPRNPAAEPLRVVFVHGLKRVRRGRTRALLEQNGFDVLSAPLNIRLHTNWATNQLLREALCVVAGWVTIVCGVLCLMHFESWWADWRHASGGLMLGWMPLPSLSHQALLC